MAPIIQEYEFGRIKIDGENFTNDVLVGPDKVRPDWWRKDGHSLIPEDLMAALEEASPRKLIIGKGYNGAMKVPDSTVKWLAERGIEVEVLPSSQAVDRYNELSGKGGVMAGLHLTC